MTRQRKAKVVRQASQRKASRKGKSSKELLNTRDLSEEKPPNDPSSVSKKPQRKKGVPQKKLEREEQPITKASSTLKSKPLQEKKRGKREQSSKKDLRDTILENLLQGVQLGHEQFIQQIEKNTKLMEGEKVSDNQQICNLMTKMTKEAFDFFTHQEEQVMNHIQSKNQSSKTQKNKKIKKQKKRSERGTQRQRKGRAKD